VKKVAEQVRENVIAFTFYLPPSSLLGIPKCTFTQSAKCLLTTINGKNFAVHSSCCCWLLSLPSLFPPPPTGTQPIVQSVHIHQGQRQEDEGMQPACKKHKKSLK
jgi:hypothetical protein